MKVLIAGATGLIGRELVSACQEQGIAVNFLTMRSGQLEAIKGAKGFLWDPRNDQIDPQSIAGVSAIVNLAGATVSKRWASSYKEQILASREVPARLLYKLLDSTEHEIEHYISASGISWYPDSLNERYTEAFSPAADSFLGQVTRTWEEHALRFNDLGVKVSLVRTGLVLDTTEGALPQLVRPVKMGVGAALGSGDQWQSWIHLRDIAGIYVHLLQQGLEGIYNGVAPSPVSNRQITKAIARILNRPLWLPAIPAWFLKLILGEMSELVLEGQWVSSEKIETAGYNFQFKELQPALEDLLKGV